MQIACPGCATSYKIDPVSLGAGRMVRCARCKTIWFAAAPKAVSDLSAVAPRISIETGPQIQINESTPVSEQEQSYNFKPDTQSMASEASPDLGAANQIAEPVAIPDSPPLVPTENEPAIEKSSPSETADKTEDDIETFATRRKRQQQTRRKQSHTSSRLTAGIFFLVVFNIALIGAREDIVRFMPQTASLFAAIGMSVNLRHLKFEDVRIVKETENGVSIFLIEGSIVPTSNRRQIAVPRLRFAARNAKGEEIYTWTAKPDRSVLRPDEKLPFISRLASPPPEAVDVLVRFFNEKDAKEPN